MNIQGKLVSLVPMNRDDKGEFYALATTSVGADRWYGQNMPSKEAFFLDWVDDYFDESKPLLGQCFWITVQGKRIGQVNYNRIDEKTKKVELDIIIGNQTDTGKGYGSDALKTLISYLFETYDLNKIYIASRSNNPRAIKTYLRVGFKQEGVLRQDEWFNGEFIDTIVFGLLRNEFFRTE